MKTHFNNFWGKCKESNENSKCKVQYNIWILSFLNFSPVLEFRSVLSLEQFCDVFFVFRREKRYWLKEWLTPCKLMNS